MAEHHCFALKRIASRLEVAVLAGFVAGTITTAAQMALWWLTSVAVVETLLRDARLTAAIVMGRGVLSSAPAWSWEILLVATFIHFSLSIVYAIIPALCASRLRTRSALLAGAVYGLVLYGVNLHGFTAFFPWFVVSRGWVTALTHVVFGIALAGVCKWLLSAHAAGPREPSSG